MIFPERWKRERATSLKALGMRDYADYLTSPLWALIRTRVYARAGGMCEATGCGAEAVAVHHWSYALKVMQGADIKPLQAVCEAHHGRAHRRGKASPKTAQRKALRAWVASGGLVGQKSKATAPRLVKRVD